MTGLALRALVHAWKITAMPRRSSHTPRPRDDLAGVHPHAAGLDSGRAAIVAARPAHRDEHPVRVVGTCSPDLHPLREWRIACGIAPVAMASTGVVWIPISAVRAAAGITGVLVNARHVTTVPGRTTDGHAAHWRHKLHEAGLRVGGAGTTP